MAGKSYPDMLFAPHGFTLLSPLIYFHNVAKWIITIGKTRIVKQDKGGRLWIRKILLYVPIRNVKAKM
jgi:hypothetical protein